MAVEEWCGAFPAADVPHGRHRHYRHQGALALVVMCCLYQERDSIVFLIIIDAVKSAFVVLIQCGYMGIFVCTPSPVGFCYDVS